jgi:hypothetical protein
MRSSFAWSVVGAIWGGGSGLIFGALPAAAIVFILLDDLWSGSPTDARAMFGICWSAILLMMTLLGAVSGYMLSRERRTQEVRIG